MKEVDDTPVDESESDYDHKYSETCIFNIWTEFRIQSKNIDHLLRRIKDLEREMAILQEQRETVRAPECQEDPEWF